MKKVVIFSIGLFIALALCGCSVIPLKAAEWTNNSEEHDSEIGDAPKHSEIVSGEEDEAYSEDETDVSDCYNVVLEAYRSAVAGQKSEEELMESGLCYLIAGLSRDGRTGEIGYAIKDFDGNGIPELAIASTYEVSEPYYMNMVFALYALDGENEPSKVFVSAERDRFYYAGDDLFVNTGSSGASDSFDSTFRYADGKLNNLGYETDTADYKQLETVPLIKS